MLKNTVYLSRRYRFSASHRLYTDSLSKEANEQIFGKCANPNGHGHNYGLTVTIRGNIDEATGFVLPLGLLDSIVFDKVISAYDHKYLNVDVEDYFTNVPTEIGLQNGGSLNVLVSGDEYFNYLHDSNGFTIIQSPKDGQYYYATRLGDDVVPSLYRADLDLNPSSLDLVPYVIISKGKYMSKRNYRLKI